MTWQAFVQRYGRHARGFELAHLLGVSIAEVEAARRRVPCAPGKPRDFGALFTLRHGRAPREHEWPTPVRSGAQSYVWLTPEYRLLAQLVGRVGTDEIARALTTRLRRVTGDPAAARTIEAVRIAQQRIGLVSADTVGGITVAAAAREIKCSSILYTEIKAGRIQTFRVGRLIVIPHTEWQRWKASRVFAPKGYVRLATLKRPLGIKSDKLSEWARMGYIPTALRANPYGTRERSTIFGTWYIDPKMARKLVADRRAGRPMPWWGKPEPGNLAVTYKLWQVRKHPSTCRDCQTIWGPAGAPTTFEDYTRRYPAIAHGAKRHLTLPYAPGLTLQDVATACRVTYSHVIAAVRIGMLRSTRGPRGEHRVSKSDAARWRARRCPLGRRMASWLAIDSVPRAYGFPVARVRQWIAAGEIASRVGTDGAQRGLTFVLRQQMRERRDDLGITEAAAARRLHISVSRLRALAGDCGWRPGEGLRAEQIQTIQTRLVSACGLTIAEAARELKKSVAWVRHQVTLGTIRLLRSPWNTHRLYVSAPMMRRLRRAKVSPVTVWKPSAEWMLASDAALLAGVCTTQLIRWANEGDIRFKVHSKYRRYHRRSVVARARVYWSAPRRRRSKRTAPPTWLDDVSAVRTKRTAA